MLGFGGLWREYGRGRYIAPWGLGGCKYDRQKYGVFINLHPQGNEGWRLGDAKYRGWV